jgi:hypothetical protein
MTCRAVLITTFYRAGNIAEIVLNSLQSQLVDRIFIACHNPAISLPHDPIFFHQKVEIIRAETPLRPGPRWGLANHLHLEKTIVIDDDTVLNGSQLDSLFQALDRDPKRLHGVIGSRFNPGSYYDAETNRSLNTYHIQETGKVDVLHQVYAVTDHHVKMFLKIEKDLKSYNLADIASVGDDIIISHCGSQKPMIHDLGPLRDLPDAWNPDIAIYCEPNFDRKRGEILKELDELGIRCIYL